MPAYVDKCYYCGTIRAGYLYYNSVSRKWVFVCNVCARVKE